MSYASDIRAQISAMLRDQARQHDAEGRPFVAAVYRECAEEIVDPHKAPGDPHKDVVRIRALALTAELETAAREVLQELDSKEWHCDCGTWLIETPHATRRVATKLDDVLVRIDMERAR